MSFEAPELLNPENETLRSEPEDGEDFSDADSAKQESRERLLTAEELAKMNYYERLGVADMATFEEVQAGFRKLSKLYHPDTDGGDTKAYQYLSEAYTFLKDPEQKKKYDEMLEKKRTYEQERQRGERERTRTGTSGFSDGPDPKAGAKKPEGPPEDPETAKKAEKAGSKNKAKSQSSTYTASSYGSGSSGSTSTGTSKPEEPPKPSNKKDKKGNFLTRFFSGLWKGLSGLFSGLS